MVINFRSLFLLILFIPFLSHAVTIEGERKQYHRIGLIFDGPQSSETATPNPFSDYRMDVTFTSPDGVKSIVPGHFAADGEAGQTGATSGNKWRVYFSPSLTGEYNYSVSFRKGTLIAASSSLTDGSPDVLDGLTGSFSVTATDKVGKDHRAKGRLHYIGKRYLRYDNGEYFLKAGSDSPENLLAFGDFDQTTNSKDFAEHSNDWTSNDPSWKSGKGKGLIGAVNYLAEMGMNAFSFLTMNINGDGNDVWPFISSSSNYFLRYDVSKLDQWEILFNHATSKGMYLHFKTQETENDQLLDGGRLGDKRKIYYRELISRFGHNNALNWNIGEEYDIGAELGDPNQAISKEIAAYIRKIDPYDNNVVLHTYPGDKDLIYGKLVGNKDALTGVSLQTGISSIYADTKKWVEASQSAGHPWIVANDEQGNSKEGVTADGNYANKGTVADNRDNVRKEVIWGNLMAGGAGFEFYFGYSTGCTDLTCDDMRSRHTKWQDANRALEFFRRHVSFWDMQPTVLTSNAHLLGKSDAYVLYSKTGSNVTFNIPASGDYEVLYYQPKYASASTGYDLQIGPTRTVKGGGAVTIANPGFSSGDYVALIRNKDSSGNGTPDLILQPSSVNLKVGDKVVVKATASDPENGALMFSVTPLPEFVTISKNQNILTLTVEPVVGQEGNYQLDVKVADDTGLSATQKLSISVDSETSSGPGIVSRINLIDASADTIVGEILNNGVIDLSKLPSSASIEVVSSAASVVMTLTGPISRTQSESAAPFALFGDSAGNFAGRTFPEGSYSLNIRAYSQVKAGGDLLEEKTVNFKIQKVVIVTPEPEPEPEPENGISYKYYYGTWSTLPNFAALTPVSTSSTSMFFSQAPDSRADKYGMVFESYLKIDTAGTYTLCTWSNDGVRLTVNGQVVVLDDGRHTAREKCGAIALSVGYHPLKVDYFQNGGVNDLSIRYSGPGVSKQPIPSGKLFLTSPTP
jgi:hypothetical protein